MQLPTGLFFSRSLLDRDMIADDRTTRKVRPEAGALREPSPVASDLGVKSRKKKRASGSSASDGAKKPTQPAPLNVSKPGQR